MGNKIKHKGRPKKDDAEKWKSSVTLRFTESEHERIAAEAAKRGLSLRAYCKSLLVTVTLMQQNGGAAA